MMTQHEKEQKLKECLDHLHMATAYAEAMWGQKITVDECSRLWTLTGRANCAVNDMRSLVAGNPPPKVGE